MFDRGAYGRFHRAEEARSIFSSRSDYMEVCFVIMSDSERAQAAPARMLIGAGYSAKAKATTSQRIVEVGLGGALFGC